MTVAIRRTEHVAADLRWLAGGSDDAAVARRLLALVLDGHKRADAARLDGIVEPRGSPETGRRCATGCIATTPRACRAWPDPAQGRGGVAPVGRAGGSGRELDTQRA